MDNIFYRVEVNTSKCSKCGRKIKNIYKYNNEDYGYYCFMEAIGKPVERNSKEKPLPSWVFEKMNEYFEKEKDRVIIKYEDNYGDFVVNFFNKYVTKDYRDHPLWNRGIEICGKRIPVYQQYMINDYLTMRLKSMDRT